MMRLGLSKRIRFDIFKRDCFACQYCGRTPPAVMLEVDHIDPVALGGPNDSDNLTTACFDCNRGKAAKPLSVIPQPLADRAFEVAEREEQLAGYQSVLQARRERLDDDVWSVFLRWRGQKETTHARFASVKRFVDLLGLSDVIDAVDVALGASIYNEGREFKYFCAVCWNKVRDNG